MGKQQSKRTRRLVRQEAFSARLDAPQAPKPKKQLIVVRPMTDAESLRSITEPLRTLREMNPSLERKKGRMALTLLYPGEVKKIAQISPYRDQISMARIAEEFANSSAGLFIDPITAHPKRIEQFGSFVSLRVNYEGYIDERFFLLSVVCGLMNVRPHQFKPYERDAHVSIAVGTMPEHPMAKHPRSLPDKITLDPAKVVLDK